MPRVLLWSLGFTKEQENWTSTGHSHILSLFRKSRRDRPPGVLRKLGAELFVAKHLSTSAIKLSPSHSAILLSYVPPLLK